MYCNKLIMILSLLRFWRRVAAAKGTRVSLVTLRSPGITESVRMQCGELTRTRKELNLVLGQISVLLSSDPDTREKPRQWSNMAFYHEEV